ncbi:uncharacterized protein LOC106654945 [Trichogramma pretiosum]|uniref:uncharacterized protein LOC106654945 n=1 Tax=Trichogramma pretiosum TaxID=7493 RepID=UPI0006C97CEB|nr:uncharacterized protein LOC106654945 [Trichogramma pretiosum]
MRSTRRKAIKLVVDSCGMKESAKLQVNMILREFTKMKNEYLELQTTNESLEKAVQELRRRLVKTDHQRQELIRMLKRKSTENIEKVESLQRENNNLRSTIEEQSNLLEDHSKKIEELRGEVKLLRDTRTNNNTIPNESFREIFHQITTNSPKKSSLPTVPVSAMTAPPSSLHFDHPSFDLTEPKKIQKSKKKRMSQPKYSNLDITYKNDSLNHNSRATSSTSSSTDSCKKRKLYCPDDDESWVELEVDGN